MRAGRVAVSFATLLAGVSAECKPHVEYETFYQSFAVARGHMAYYHALEKAGIARIITTRVQLERHIEEWEAWEHSGATESAAPPLGFIINIEGADPIQNPDELDF
jgi:membrane dipeptidase